MTKDVILTIERTAENGSELEAMYRAEGVYKCLRGVHTVAYKKWEGTDEEGGGVLRLWDGYLKVSRPQITDVPMVFERGQESTASYRTPAGLLSVTTRVTRMTFTETPDRIEAEVRYHLELAGEQRTDCRILVRIQPR